MKRFDFDPDHLDGILDIQDDLEELLEKLLEEEPELAHALAQMKEAA